jgi:hypothetical protein
MKRKEYTDKLERDVGNLREANKVLKGRAVLLAMTLQKVNAEVDSAIAAGQVCNLQGPISGTALKAALMALGNARMQCPVTFGDSTDRSDIPPTPSQPANKQ